MVGRFLVGHGRYLCFTPALRRAEAERDVEPARMRATCCTGDRVPHPIAHGSVGMNTLAPRERREDS
eukprot:4251399-Prymnesium_polylepis.1